MGGGRITKAMVPLVSMMTDRVQEKQGGDGCLGGNTGWLGGNTGLMGGETGWLRGDTGRVVRTVEGNPTVGRRSRTAERKEPRETGG